MPLGARFDAWLTTQPEAPDIPSPGDEFYPRCGKCGAFLKRDEFATITGEKTMPCDGKRSRLTKCDGRTVEWDLGFPWTTCGRQEDHEPHEFVMMLDFTQCDRVDEHEPHDAVMYAWDIEIRLCSRCGHKDERVV